MESKCIDEGQMIHSLTHIKKIHRALLGGNKPKVNVFVLVAIYQINDGEPVKTSDIANRLQVSNAAVTQMIDAQVKHGYLVRIADEKDRRIIMIGFTPAGQALVRKTTTHINEFYTALFAELGEEDSKEFVRIIEHVFKFCDEYIDETHVRRTHD